MLFPRGEHHYFFMAPGAGFEPATHWLTANCSTAELPGIVVIASLFFSPRKTRYVNFTWGGYFFSKTQISRATKLSSRAYTNVFCAPKRASGV